MQMHIFLGGTCNGSTWRDDFVKLIAPDYTWYNPVVEDWTPECKIKEDIEKSNCDMMLYVITPKLTGVYSIAEVMYDSCKRPKNTILVVLDYDILDNGVVSWTEGMRRSVDAVVELVEKTGTKVFRSLLDCANYLNIGDK